MAKIIATAKTNTDLIISSATRQSIVISTCAIGIVLEMYKYISEKSSVLFRFQEYFKLSKKGYVLFIAQYPVHWTAQCALHVSSPDRLVHFDTNSASPGSILAIQQLRATTKHSNSNHCL